MKWRDYEYALDWRTPEGRSGASIGYVRAVSERHARFILQRDKLPQGAERSNLQVQRSAWNKGPSGWNKGELICVS